MANGEVSWWHTCHLKTQDPTDTWFVLFEFFRSNGNAFAVSRVAASDGLSAWEGTFSADELSALTNIPSRAQKVLEIIQQTCEKEVEDALHIHVDSSSSAVLKFSFHQGGEANFKLDTGVLSISSFANRIALYHSHLNEDLLRKDSEASSLEKERESIEKKLAIDVTRSLEEEKNMASCVRVLMQQKLDHFEKRNL